MSRIKIAVHFDNGYTEHLIVPAWFDVQVMKDRIQSMVRHGKDGRTAKVDTIKVSVKAGNAPSEPYWAYKIVYGQVVTVWPNGTITA